MYSPFLWKRPKCIDLLLQVKSLCQQQKWRCYQKWRCHPFLSFQVASLAALDSFQKLLAPTVIPGMKAISLCAPHRSHFPKSVSASKRNVCNVKELFILGLGFSGVRESSEKQGIRGSLVSFADAAHVGCHLYTSHIQDLGHGNSHPTCSWGWAPLPGAALSGFCGDNGAWGEGLSACLCGEGRAEGEEGEKQE